MKRKKERNMPPDGSNDPPTAGKSTTTATIADSSKQEQPHTWSTAYICTRSSQVPRKGHLFSSIGGSKIPKLKHSVVQPKQQQPPKNSSIQESQARGSAAKGKKARHEAPENSSSAVATLNKPTTGDDQSGKQEPTAKVSFAPPVAAVQPQKDQQQQQQPTNSVQQESQTRENAKGIKARHQAPENSFSAVATLNKPTVGDDKSGKQEPTARVAPTATAALAPPVAVVPPRKDQLQSHGLSSQRQPTNSVQQESQAGGNAKGKKLKQQASENSSSAFATLNKPIVGDDKRGKQEPTAKAAPAATATLAPPVAVVPPRKDQHRAHGLSSLMSLPAPTRRASSIRQGDASMHGGKIKHKSRGTKQLVKSSSSDDDDDDDHESYGKGTMVEKRRSHKHRRSPSTSSSDEEQIPNQKSGLGTRTVGTTTDDDDDDVSYRYYSSDEVTDDDFDDDDFDDDIGRSYKRRRLTSAGGKKPANKKRGRGKRKTKGDDADDDSSSSSSPRWTEVMATAHILQDEVQEYLSAARTGSNNKEKLSTPETKFLLKWNKTVQSELAEQNSLVLANIKLSMEKQQIDRQIRKQRTGLVALQLKIRRLQSEQRKLGNRIITQQQDQLNQRGASRFLDGLDRLRAAAQE